MKSSLTSSCFPLSSSMLTLLKWGDAAVHSLAVGLLVGPERVHHFSDFAYRHDSFQQCPANAPGLQLVNSSSPLVSSSPATSILDSALFTMKKRAPALSLSSEPKEQRDRDDGPGVPMSTSVALGDALFSPEQEGGVGCRCTCDASRSIGGETTRNYPGYCTNKLKQPTNPKRYWFTWFL